MVLLALRKFPLILPGAARRMFPARPEMDARLPMQRRRLEAAFDKDCTKGILEKVPFADHNAMLDPECADITARILELMGYEGFSVDHPQIKKAIQFLRDEQEEDGSWYGRWGVNFVYGTWQVLRGMRASWASNHAAAVVAEGPRLAGECAARRRRLGRAL